MRTHHWILLAAIVLGLGLRLPGWFTEDDKRQYRLFEPDEIQHVEIALIQLEKMAPDLELPETREQVNARGYGKLLGVVAYGWWRLSGQEPNVPGLVLMGRQLSTVYFLLLLGVVFGLARDLGLTAAAAAWSALLLALCDLNATYSHYAVPASGYLLLLTFFIWGGVRYWSSQTRSRGNKVWAAGTPPADSGARGSAESGLGSAGASSAVNYGLDGVSSSGTDQRFYKFSARYLRGLWCGMPALGLMALGAGGSFAFKFDFLPTAVGLAVLLAVALSVAGPDGRRPGVAWGATLARIVFFLAATVFFYRLCVAFNFSWAGMAYSFEIMSQENRDVITQDLHWWYNPTLYLLAVVAGIGLPACGAALFGTMHVLHSAQAEPRPWWHRGWWIPALLLFLEFGVRWSIDTPFVRRANEFMPLLVILAAYGLHRTGRSRRRARTLRWAVAAYGLALCLVGQSNHWFDTRVRARDYLQEHYPTDTWRIGYTEYTRVKDSPESGRFRRGEWDVLATGEPWYSRFHKSFTTPTPGRQPHCASEIYHNPSAAECAFFQRLLRGEHPHVRQVAHFRTHTVLPERWLYRWLFGTFETFVGDVRIYEWTDNDSEPPAVMK